MASMPFMKKTTTRLLMDRARHFDLATDLLCVVDAAGCIEQANSAWLRILGRQEADVVGTLWRECVHPDDRVAAAMILSTQNEAARRGVELRTKTADGSYIWMSWSRTGVSSDGKVFGVARVVHARSVSPPTALGPVSNDALTGLPTRRWLMKRVETILESAPEGEAVLGMVAYADIDRFGNLNAVYGHGVGDLLLQAVAKRIGEAMRTSDAICRVASNEYATVGTFPGLHDPAACEAIARAAAERIRAVVSEPFALNGMEISCTVSVGVTLLHAGRASASEVLREAQSAMRQAKALGGNCVQLFEAGMLQKADGRLAIERDLKSALPRDEMSLNIQSQVDAGGRVIGAEVLLQWTHPLKGNVPPDVFIPVAEETGLIVEIGNWVLQQACALQARLQGLGLQIPLSINVSPRQFRHPGFMQQVRAAMDTTGALPTNLILEVTEGLLIEDLDLVVARMRELADLGLRLSVDDFGTGYSSLAYLKRLPMSELKIDKSFVRDVATGDKSEAIIKSVLALASNLNLNVVAEGVETREQADFLLAQGCKVLQGYMFGRPIPAAEWLAQVARV